ncbi:zeta toxin family protein [Nocardiopsis sp. MG754419]|uniref:zeta toxin family protein n=1 Tax=Nocardiopsis sp. MG754419 TaxID=2259865 RepID=UPI001BAC3292|nr:zeta toxin family protein [Nocardiopsis sp. MG754419]MBR8742563.1 toxin [Nocardiopsis sp. MG754419]
MTSSSTETGPGPRAERDRARTLPLLAECPDGVPFSSAERRASEERAHHLYSAAIGACAGRWDDDPEVAARAAPLLDEEVRLPFLTPEEVDRVCDTLPGVLAELRATPVRVPAGATPDRPRALSEERLDSLFDRALRDRLTGVPRRRPRLLLFGGQPGSGTSTLQRRVLPVLPPGTVSYDRGDLMRLSPDYEWAMSADDRAASIAVSHQVGGLHARSMEHVREGRFDVVRSDPLGRADRAASRVLAFKEAGYRVEVAFVATHTSHSRFSLLDRHARATREQGFGRWIPQAHHDRSYLGVPNTIEFLETHRLVDSLYVLSREGEVLYADHRDDGGRRHEPFGRLALEVERGRRELWRSDDPASVY